MLSEAKHPRLLPRERKTEYLRFFAALRMTGNAAVWPPLRINTWSKSALLELQFLVCRHFPRYRFKHAPDVFSNDLLAGCIRMNAVRQIQRRIACHAFKQIGHQRRSIFRG